MATHAMRIVIDYTPALRQTAGVGRYTRSLVGALAEIDLSNRYTLFHAGESASAAGWPPNFGLRRNPVPARWLAAAWHRLHLPLPADWLAGGGDIFHSTDFALPPLARARGVVTVHDLSFLRVPACADPGLRAFLERAVPAAVQRADLVLADSANTRDDLVKLLGVPAERVCVVHGGVEPRFRRVRDEALLAEVRARYNLPEHFILSVGTLEPRKNYVRLIAAYAALARRDPALPHRLVIAGRPGWLYDEIYAQVERERLGDRVLFLGFTADADLPALFSLADLFVYPSLYEGFGLPPLEAVACAAPVVAGDNSSLPETLGDAGLLVNVEDVDALAAAMERALSDGELRTRLAECGARQAARFTWAAAAHELLDAYRLVLAHQVVGRNPVV